VAYANFAEPQHKHTTLSWNIVIRLSALFLAVSFSLQASQTDWAKWNSYALDLLQRYIRIASVDPPADTRPTASLIQTEFEKHGFTVAVYPSGPLGQTNLVIRLKGRDSSLKPLLLSNHMDVVPVDRAAWRIDPFGGIVKDGMIWGRGALDMKGVGVEQMVALMALKENGVIPTRDIVMLCTADEEAGGTYGIQWMIKNHFADIDAAFVLDEGGLGSREALAGGKLTFGVAVGEKQLLWLKIKAKGTAGHGSQPIADNANVILLHALERALDVPPSARKNETVAEMQRRFGALAENKFTAAIQKNTISLTTLRSGVGDPVKPNVIPSAAEATLDCRLLPGENSEEFLSEIKARINDQRVIVETLNHSADPGSSRTDTPLFAAVEEALKKNYPGAIVSPMLVPYGTDSVRMRERGIPAYGLIPMVLDTATLATMHSDEERIPLDSFYIGIRVFYDVLTRM
jgi:acetylornithine deacetylase/succinyl-diaminopimelate desuccinylase-like protein